MHPSDMHRDDLAAEIVAMAAKFAGNWQKFEAFGWHDQPEENAEQWCIIYTTNRDADALTRSNARVMAKALDAFDDDTCRAEHHGHWACGWVDGYAIRVYAPDGAVTPAFKAYAELALALENYPILDETDFSEEERQEADEVWRGCYSTSERIAYIRKHRTQFEFCDFADMLGCIRGKYFAGYASELLG